MRSIALAALTTCVLALAAGNASAATAGDFVGRAGTSDVFVALSVAPDGKVVAYICDGRRGRLARTWAWFAGRLNGDRLDVRSKGIRLTATVVRGAAKVKAGWIVLNNGQARGFTSDNPTLRNAGNDMFLQVKRFFAQLEAGTATIQDADRAEELQNTIEIACY